MDDEDRWFGVFQGYRPHGDGAEEVFAGLPDAAEYVERLRSVCRAALHPDWARDAYFVVRTPPEATDEELVGLGRELLSGLRLIAVLATLSGRRDLHEYLGGVSRVAVVPLGGVDRRHDDHSLVHEAVGDILRGFCDYGHRAVQLREGFYSVACDYWLAWFLQWPYFRQWVPRDVFRPYFELWARGYEVAFQGSSLGIARHAEPSAAADPAR
jgi:hypothetical protein